MLLLLLSSTTITSATVIFITGQNTAGSALVTADAAAKAIQGMIFLLKFVLILFLRGDKKLQQ